MDNSAAALLDSGLQKLQLALDASARTALLAWADELLKWNPKVSLTAITRPEEIVDKHLLDSLAVLPEVIGTAHVLDLGAGAGLPGIPLAVALPDLRVTLVDAVSKKVSFIKSAAVKAGVATRVRALHARAEGQPETEHIPVADCVISRAFMDVGPFLQLARHYVSPGGRIVTMMGQTPAADALETLATAAGCRLVSRRTFALPVSGDPRGVAVFHVER
ncbi:MAG: 16S rRNA (guanine(527)-N(7))-methyltransferase RsmG [Archangium sp.]